jgi:DNA polymerase III sliding clamp (beta) subunit (PCNA family)
MNCTWKSTLECLALFKSIQHTNTMINVAFSGDGLSIMSMDASKTSLVKLALKPQYFETYQCTRPMVFGIYTEVLTNVLQKAKGTTVTWKASDMVALTIVMSAKDFKTEIRLRSIDIEDDQLAIPELEDDVALIVPATVLKNWFDKVQMTKGDVAFDITRTQFICSSESTEIGEIKHTEPIGGERIQLSAFRNEVNIALSFHSTRSLAVFAGCGGEQCFVGFSNQQPSRIQVALDGTSVLSLYVAPKIMDD